MQNNKIEKGKRFFFCYFHFVYKIIIIFICQSYHMMNVRIISCNCWSSNAFIVSPFLLFMHKNENRNETKWMSEMREQEISQTNVISNETFWLVGIFFFYFIFFHNFDTLFPFLCKSIFFISFVQNPRGSNAQVSISEFFSVRLCNIFIFFQ